MLPGLGFSEILVLAVLALLVLGPKDLPLMLRKLGRWMAQLRGMAAEFRAGFDELARQAELDELKREVEALRNASQRGLMGMADELSRPVDMSPIRPQTAPAALPPPTEDAQPVAELEPPAPEPLGEPLPAEAGIAAPAAKAAP